MSTTSNAEKVPSFVAESSLCLRESEYILSPHETMILSMSVLAVITSVSPVIREVPEGFIKYHSSDCSKKLVLATNSLCLKTLTVRMPCDLSI